MGLPAEKNHVSVEEYLRLEQASAIRHEYDDGEVLAMSGGSYEHSMIVINVGAALHASLVATSCRALDSNLKVGVTPSRKFIYPDVQVICGAPQFDPCDPSRQTIINPRLVVEVLSPTTEAYDQGAKFMKYRSLESFQEYVLVSQTVALVETFFRQPDGVWLFSPFAGVDGVVKLRSLGVELRLGDIYAGVQFPEPAVSTDESPRMQ